jgi:putative tryptophan/tyrosine transport system substrate-binding protein
MRRREFIAGLGGAAAWPVVARAQQPALPVVGFINPASLDTSARNLAAFRAGLGETGYVEGQNVTIEYQWLDGQFDRVPALVADLVLRRVAVIDAGTQQIALAAKAATATIPIVFGVGDDPVRLGLVASLARPGGNVTGMNFLTFEVVQKRLELLRELVPKANRVSALVNPRNSGAEASLREVQDAARVTGWSVDVLRAGTSREIEEAFATLLRGRAEALFVVPDGYFFGRRVQIAILAAHHGIATSFGNRDYVEAGGLMSYGIDIADMFHQVGAYTGRILKGAKPADLPVVQSTRFEFVINMQTAKALGIEVPPTMLVRTDLLIE